MMANGAAEVSHGLRIFLVPAEREAADNLLSYAETRPDRDGGFSLRNIAPGDYRRLVLPEDHLPAKISELPVSFLAPFRLKLQKEATRGNLISLTPCQSFAEIVLNIPQQRLH
jgi:hypothetical protein